jgi:hypothetical protein
MAVRSLRLKIRFYSKEHRSFDVKMLSMAPLPLRVEKVTSNLHRAVLIISYFFQANTVTTLFEEGHDHFNSDDPKVFISFNVK